MNNNSIMAIAYIDDIQDRRSLCLWYNTRVGGLVSMRDKTAPYFWLDAQPRFSWSTPIIDDSYLIKLDDYCINNQEKIYLILELAYLRCNLAYRGWFYEKNFGYYKLDDCNLTINGKPLTPIETVECFKKRLLPLNYEKLYNYY